MRAWFPAVGHRACGARLAGHRGRAVAVVAPDSPAALAGDDLRSDEPGYVAHVGRGAGPADRPGASPGGSRCVVPGTGPLAGRVGRQTEGRGAGLLAAPEPDRRGDPGADHHGNPRADHHGDPGPDRHGHPRADHRVDPGADRRGNPGADRHGNPGADRHGSSGEDPAESPGEDPAESPGEDPAGGPGEDPAESPGEDPAGGPGEDPAESPGTGPNAGPRTDRGAGRPVPRRLARVRAGRGELPCCCPGGHPGTDREARRRGPGRHRSGPRVDRSSCLSRRRTGRGANCGTHPAGNEDGYPGLARPPRTADRPASRVPALAERPADRPGTRPLVVPASRPAARTDRHPGQRTSARPAVLA
jgi:hypothetical protein